MKHRRFAGLSIITCGNDDVLGFSNMGHVDNDHITLHGSDNMVQVLNRLERESHQNSDMYDVLLHLRNK